MVPRLQWGAGGQTMGSSAKADALGSIAKTRGSR